MELAGRQDSVFERLELERGGLHLAGHAEAAALTVISEGKLFRIWTFWTVNWEYSVISVRGIHWIHLVFNLFQSVYSIFFHMKLLGAVSLSLSF